MGDLEPIDIPGPKHKVIGLISGGKDSCFNLLHCVANGHELVALATLTPDSSTDELDSHLYQSVGTSLPPLIAESMGLPHYSRVIKGKAVSRGPEYGDRHSMEQGSGTEGDETEDLYTLLKDIMEEHPECTAVASGAILSTYQRVRIEHVCSRLGLISLAYLWQSEQIPLLESMQRAGMDVILVKVAGVGLTEEMVGKSLFSQMPTLRKLERIYGSHPAGEGGEYETLTLDSPLMSGRIRIIESRIVVTDPEPNLVAYLKIEKAVLEEKGGWRKPTIAELREMLGAKGYNGEEWLDQRGTELYEELKGHPRKKRRVDRPTSEISLDLEKALKGLSVEPKGGNQIGRTKIMKNGRWFSISTDESIANGAVSSQIKACFDRLSKTLLMNGLSLPLHATHITLLLPSMSLFPLANKTYSEYFGISPPSRATVAVPLPSDTGVRIEVIGFDDRPSLISLSESEKGNEVEGGGRGEKSVGDRSALHVQSLSYWAPANIGPYSQSITVDHRIHIAGQIPLLPPTLTIPPYTELPSSTNQFSHIDYIGDYEIQCALALQHVRKIIEVLRSPSSTGGGWEGWVESCTAWWALPDLSDVGKLNKLDVEVIVGIINQAWEVWAAEMNCLKAPIMVVRAKELPKAALVEFQVNLHTGRKSVPDEDEANIDGGCTNIDDGYGDNDNDDDDELEYVCNIGGDDEVWYESIVTSGTVGRGSRTMIFLKDLNTPLSAQTTEGLKAWLPTVKGAKGGRTVSIKAYYLASIPESIVISKVGKLLFTSSEAEQRVEYTLVPVYQINDRRGESAVVALEVFGI